MNKEKNFVSAVIYVHNSESRIEYFLKKIINVLVNNFEKSEIICVNDFSNDKSLDVIKRVSKETDITSVSILNMSYFHGLECAMTAGVDLSIGDFVFEFDSTIMDYDSSEILKVYFASLEGFDIVSASPEKKQRASSFLFYRLFEKNTVLNYNLSTESFRILSRRVINRISVMNKDMPYRKAVYANCGLKTKNLRYAVSNEFSIEEDKLEKKYRFELAINALMIFTNLGYRFSVLMTVIMMLISVSMGGYSIIVYFFGTPVEGWGTTILFLSCAFFGLFGILTIIIKYLQIIVGLVFKRKRYSFESIVKLTK